MNNCNKMDLSPKRKIGLTRRSVSGVYMFRRQTAIPHESTLERDFLIRTEFFLDVAQILPQPVRIPFTGGNGRAYTYTPDFLVTYRPTKEGCREPALVEVKPNEQWRRHWRKWRPKWKAAIRFAKEHCWKFRIHDELRIRDSVLQNVRFLEPYKRMRLVRGEGQRIVAALRAMGPTPMRTILEQHWTITNQDQGAMILWHLVAIRKLDCEITGPMDHDTKLWVAR